jgi:hypothetical protein
VQVWKFGMGLHQTFVSLNRVILVPLFGENLKLQLLEIRRTRSVSTSLRQVA